MTEGQDWNAKASQCREQLKAKPRDTFAASQLLQALRESAKGGSPFPILAEARKMWQQFRTDQWVSFRYAWILFDVCKARIAQKEPSEACRTLEEMLQLVPILGDRKGGLLEQLARLYHDCVKKMKEGPSEQRQIASDLAGLGRQLRPVVLPVLPTAVQQSQDGRPFPSKHDLFLSDLRGTTDRAQEWESLRDLCMEVLDKRIQVDDEKWFGNSLLKCLAHVPETPDVRVLVDRYLTRHGDDEFVQISLGEWRSTLGDAEGAALASTRSLALAHTPWPWESFAEFLANQNRNDDAACCLRGGLSLLDPDAIGKTWRLHFRLAQCAVGLGRPDEAAAEAHLARACRESSGWPVDKQLDDFFQIQADFMGEHLVETAKLNVKQLLQSRRQAYVNSRNEYLRRLALPHVVTRSDRERGLAWFRPISGGPDAIHRWRPPKSGPDSGQQVLAITVPSWDRAKERPGLRVAWWTPADEVGPLTKS